MYRPRPALPAAHPDPVARWLHACAHLGPARLTVDTLHTAGLPTGDLLDTTLDLRHYADTGIRHVPTGCHPKRCGNTLVPPDQIQTTPTSLAQIAWHLPPSRRHACMADVMGHVPAPVRAELAMLHDADLLSAPWREALAETARYDRPFLPADPTPMLAGLLHRVGTDMRAWADHHPGRDHLHTAGTQVLAWHADWAARHHDWPAIQAADPHQAILRWQRGEGLPALAGSTKQVRWAERIRHDFAHAHAAGFDIVAAREQNAGAWIGLSTADPDTLLDAWLDQRDRVLQDASGRAGRGW